MIKNWFLDTKNNAWFICDEQGRRIAKILNQPDRDENAALIFAAPGLQRERDEALAYGERLRTVARGLIADCEEAVFNDENVFCVNQDVVSDLEEVTEEQPPAALAALKADAYGKVNRSVKIPDGRKTFDGIVPRNYQQEKPCTYPDCRCPLELPHKDSPCAMGRRKEVGDESTHS